MGKKKNNESIYFTEQTQQAIVSYNETTSLVEKNRLFKEQIYPAFDKLVENIIHTWKFYQYETTYDDLKIETISFLVEKLSRYTQEQGKAYSFFTVVARNYLIQRTSGIYRAKSQSVELGTVDEERNVVHEVYSSNRKEHLQNFIELWSRQIEQNLDKTFSTQRDRAIADSVLELFRTCQDIEDFSKKKLYILVRERAGVKTQHITKVVNLLRKKFATDYSYYVEGSYSTT